MRTISRILSLLLLIALPTSVLAEKPLWVSGSLSSLDKERSNESYSFRKFETFNSDINQLRKDRFNPLVGYLANTYGLDSASATVTRLSGDARFESVPDDAVGDTRVQSEYQITFSEPRQVTFYAKLADEYISLDENADQSYDFTLNQLYAVSADDSGKQPVYDNFDLSRKYGGKALALSIVPGLGQLYKGQKTKGWVIIGGEVGFVAMAIYADHRARNYADDFKNADDAIAPSYRSKKKSWQNIRNVAIAGACGLYVYNLFDAASLTAPAVSLSASPTAPSSHSVPALSTTPRRLQPPPFRSRSLSDSRLSNFILSVDHCRRKPKSSACLR